MALRMISPPPIYSAQPKPLLIRGLSPSLRLSGGIQLSSAATARASHPLEEEKEEVPSLLPDTPLVQELEELPEQWRRTKVAWLCKQLPGIKPGVLTRLLNAQRKWISQQDVSYLVVHCLRIRENDVAFKVYRWMLVQPRFSFAFALADKLADCLGKDGKFLKCREIFDGIIREGRVPSESNFENLAAAYLSAASSVHGCLDEACSIYNKMIEIGGYAPRLSLHNSLFRAIATDPGSFSRRHLDQAEFVFSNIANRGVRIQKDVYSGLIRIHSHQDPVDIHRIKVLRDEMLRIGFAEEVDVLTDLLRACSRAGDVEEAITVWEKLLERGSIPVQAFIHRMELHARIGEPMQSLAIFRSMSKLGVPPTSSAYEKIIEVMVRSGERDLTEELLRELGESGLKPSASSFSAVMDLYLRADLHDKIEELFHLCHSKIRPSRGVYGVYLNSLAKSGNVDRAKEVFGEMLSNSEIGINSYSCNTILGVFLASEDYPEAEKIYVLMSRKKFEIDPTLDQILSLKMKKKNTIDKKMVRPNLDVEQREILIGLLLAGLRMESDESSGSSSVFFDFNLDNPVHAFLRERIHRRFREWLQPSSAQEDENLPHQFSTVSHRSFDFFAEKFRPKWKPAIPALIHRWLSDCALAYWYMYGGLRSSSGDILLKLKGVEVDEEVQRIAKVLQAKSMSCRIKKKGKTTWIGLRGDDADRFWYLTEVYILEGAKEYLRPSSAVGSKHNQTSDNDEDDSVSS